MGWDGTKCVMIREQLCFVRIRMGHWVRDGLLTPFMGRYMKFITP